MTLSIPGTARTVITVASVDASLPIRVASYSSYGPTRDLRDKPDVAAPGENVLAAQSGTANGVVQFFSGTSMAKAARNRGDRTAPLASREAEDR